MGKTTKKGLAAIPFLNFPGFSRESAEFLTPEQNIAGIAPDSRGIDNGRSQDFMVHRVICGADKLALGNIANPDNLPPSGSTHYVMPMDIRGGTGATARVFAIIPSGIF